MKLHEIQASTNPIADDVVAVIQKFNSYMEELGFEEINAWNHNQDGEDDFVSWTCASDDAAPVLARWVITYRHKVRKYLHTLMAQHQNAWAVIKPDSFNLVEMDRPDQFGSDNPLRVSLNLEGPPLDGYVDMWKRLDSLRIK